MMKRYNRAFRCPQLIFLALIAILVLTADETRADEYTVRPGDTITVTVRERDWLSSKVVVAPNGQIILPRPIGAVDVLGLTVDQVTEELTERLKEYIVEPNVFVSISPDTSLTIHVTGEVQSPRSFKTMHRISLQEAITQAGGFTPLADRSAIKILHQAEEQTGEGGERRVDFTQFEETADPMYNPYLGDGDVVIVPRLPESERAPAIMVVGSVNRPGAVPTESPLSLVEVLGRVGGTTLNANLAAVSILAPRNGGYTRHELNFEGFLTGRDPMIDRKVAPGEIVFVPERVVEQKELVRVNVIGEVIRPGAYQFEEGARLLDAIAQSGGFTDDAAIDRTRITRFSNPHPKTLEVDARTYFTRNDGGANPLIEDGDTILVPMQQNSARDIPGVQTTFLDSISVTLLGEVKQAETYRVASDATVLDLLKLAGGPTRDADLEEARLIREGERAIPVNLKEVFEEGELGSLPPLQTGDTLFIPRVAQGRGVWRTLVRAALDVSTLVTAFLLIERRID